ncbi:DNA polymerase III, subunit gamma and tau [Candidatus Falkowbacteria bacterium RIFOXYB2_FULL_34_18]|uniref:DNA polymerase III subunit gamma/tau n=1 Tax=Candidatus Falkowbacteria bacterium RIFOXYD2_FULL_34_120 TaxID=1798007 RepID=A0A1F5TQS6_9BACT|nr:MAG: DNA polymerase III, subunit gamma and tau [Candidatus Falkowbacteria bacterium RIFOXYB2_FULL_34_18]OGF29267.1 MAG: DNA polymerase III, subunit gamma and tau [Candidatus Falkowbacteria bacterium RIFOXYC12_FULL_34_55]OGF36383.1 MAG: DNA polymerase III, subunit gamma and tau [Candidatus Falkowbacteria bacterium RIFOXYC2_FULL_34_220]OGF38862.1 MAG: DNA polymerase III, subunit gamma and tau [Candidatus Falkowbacteria bacterium RIFOXYD12_FULL_34_57]OGF40881.1 MAG: DNA polymerase III, subunit 
MATLYRKYRPLTFKDLVGQNHIKTTLEYEVASGKIAHAYLFCGPRGIGKTTIARILAKSINCQNRKDKEYEPCDQCSSCLDVKNDKSLDIIEIDAASHTGVDNVRENIISASRIAPTSLKYKVFIIDEVHMLSNQAFSALLKILEEPPKNVLFILCTTEIHKIPATIISRCQRFDFKKIGVKDIVKKLQYIVTKEKIQVSLDVLEDIARHADGHMRDAESLLGQVIVIGGKEITAKEADLVIPRSDIGEVVKLINFLTKKDAGSAIDLVNTLIGDGVDIKRFLSDMIEVLRKVMLFKVSPLLSEKIGNDFGGHIEKEINKATGAMDLNRVISLLESFLRVRGAINHSFIVQLPIEIAIAELCLGERTSNIVAQNQASPILNIDNNSKKFTKNNNLNQKTEDEETIVNSRLIDKNEIQSKWNEVLAKVKQQNHSLSFILRVCQPKDIQGNQLCLAFKYKFHKDRVGDINIKRLVENILRDVYGQPITIEAVIDEKLKVSDGGDSVIPPENIKEPHSLNAADICSASLQGNQKSGDDQPIINDQETSSKENQPINGGKMIENLLKTFGGEVIS